MNWEKILKLKEFDTPTVANGLELLKVMDPSAGYTGPDVRSLMPQLGRVVGIAATSRMDTTSPGMDNPPSLFNDWLRLMQKTASVEGGLTIPVFAVMESVGPRPKYTVTIGDRMATLMKLAGAAGFVTNGSIRDLEGVTQVPLPSWGAGLSPMHGKLRWLDVGSPVVIDGMTVRTGDIIMADENGVICIPPAVADQVYDKAVSVQQTEEGFFRKVSEPGMTLDAYLGAYVKSSR
ncbi:MAG TPA: RraA family protein [Chloroflexota bacterium]|nr:RraA family protein [Chloroflexota bacterium]